MPGYHYQRGAPREWREDREREEQFRAWRVEQRWAQIVAALKLIGVFFACVLVAAAIVLELAPRRRR